jgi:poly-gamma-glutamate capsule biosynthesis protein CapA/YwtB (metallophosphatase superfamily)
VTGFDKAVRRKTLGKYRIAIGGAVRAESGKPLVVELHGDQAGDWLSIREAGRRYRLTLDVAELYRMGLMAQAAAELRQRRKEKKGRG